MKILLTGAAGFIGFHLAKKLIEENIQTYAIDNLNDYYDVKIKKERIKILKRLANKKKTLFKFYKFDLSKKKNFKKLEKMKFNVIVNLAAQAGVRYSLINPHSYIDSNILGFLNILELARKKKKTTLIYASTSSVYGGSKAMPFNERNTAVHPLQLYAATKRSNELMAHSYSYLYGINTIGLRFFTVYGPWGRPDMALYIFTKKILAGEPIDVFGFGKMRRDFTYIDDIVEGVFSLLDKKPSGDSNWSGKNPNPSNSSAPWEVFNIGNNKPTELEYFISLIEKNLNKKAIKNYLEMQPGDVEETAADISKLNKMTGFVPSTSIEDGIPKFISWYRTFHN